MTFHRLEPTPGAVIDVFSRDTPAVLTVDPGDTLVVKSLDAHGYLERPRTPGEVAPRMFAEARGHCLAGPVDVRGAEPGTVLAVHVKSVTPDDWGWTVAAAKDNWLSCRLGVAGGPPAWLLWGLDWDADALAGTGTNNLGQTVRLAPFLGVIGLPPAEPGEHSTIPPRTLGGGNIDCRDLIAGSTLYLPVTVPGAHLLLGDGHAAQGDGEVSGTAIECAMTSEIVVDVVPETSVPGIHAETPSGRITFGFHENLNEAMADALEAMVIWLQSQYDLDKATALALASPAVNMRVTQVADGTWGAHAVLPEGAIR